VADEGRNDLPEAADAFYAALGDDNPEDLYENAPCGYLSTTLDGTIVKVNATFLRWTGFAAADLVGSRTFAELLTVGGRIFHETHYAPLLRMQGRVREIAVDVVCADGRRLPVLVNSVVARADATRPALIRTALFDATERRQYEHELVEARRRAEESEARVQLLATTLQESLLPPAPPAIPGLEVATAYRPAGTGTEIGGDFSDVFEVPSGAWAVLVGDVRGKGVEAATVASLARHTLRAAAMRTALPRVALQTLHQALEREATERFCTAVFARVRRVSPGRFRLVVASGGHPLPLLASADGRVSPIGRHGTLLGVVDVPTLEDTAVDLHPGDVVVFYTDGVPEGRRGREFYGEERLAELVRARRATGAAGVAEAVVEDVLAFQEGVPRDDIAIVALAVPQAG
jgi:sigma-B regulation protein RsbU (phosphoserine phosphatase)